MKKFLSIFLALCLCATALVPVPARAEYEEPVMRVGLSYGGSVVEGATLVNEKNSGYRFGYYDAGRVFVPLAETEETRITVLKTEMMYLNSQGTYSGSKSNAVATLGYYHIQFTEPFEDLASAREAASEYEDGFVAWIRGEYFVRLGLYATAEEADAAIEAMELQDAVSRVSTSAYSLNVFKSGTTQVLFQFDAGETGETNALGVEPGLQEDVKAVTKYNPTGNTYYGGFRFERITGGNITVVNMVGLEDYVKGVVPYEMSASWPIEALKAQAVAARTYAMVRARHENYHMDLCTTTDCQVYYGTGRANANSDRAVEETQGLFALYKGKIIEATYFSSDGGATEDAKNLWGGSSDYLKGKVDPYEADVADSIPNYYWTKTFTAESLKELLNGLGYACSDVESFCISRVSDSGNAIEVRVQDSTGKTYSFSRQKVRSYLGVKTLHFTMDCSGGATIGSGYVVAGSGELVSDITTQYAIDGEGNVVEVPAETYILTADGVKLLEPVEIKSGSGANAVYTITGSGTGHGVGMSQWGANAMAKRGMDFREILTFYYTGITVEPLK